MTSAAVVLDAAFGRTNSTDFGLIRAMVEIVLFLPALSVFVRRLHDRDRSGWWYWLLLVPIVGLIVLVIWLCQRGTDGPNHYGDDPLAPVGSTG